MNEKKQRREAAQRRAKKKRLTILVLCVACLMVVVTAAIIYVATRPDSRVFAVSGGQSVTLYENGRFVARLFHNMNISGNFTEDVSGNITTISFFHGGNTVSTQIENDVLILPISWRATCRIHSHEIAFPLVQGETGNLVQNDNNYYSDAVTEYESNIFAEDYIIVLSDPDFTFQIQEILWNRYDFLGRTIRFEGMFLSSFWENETVYFVARIQGGCCGMHGFEVYLNEFSRFEDETWVEVTGVLEEFYVEGANHYFLRLNVISLVER
ncbi:MAG: hypothetical protein FWC07_02235 [Defluviitaleaceae bacterium]|nr:hypothetical protein [Defluviitaleaceae bacterium]